MSNKIYYYPVTPEYVEEVIKKQLEIEQCSPGKYYPFNETTWKLYEEKTGKKPFK